MHVGNSYEAEDILDQSNDDQSGHSIKPRVGQSFEAEDIDLFQPHWFEYSDDIVKKLHENLSR